MASYGSRPRISRTDVCPFARRRGALALAFAGEEIVFDRKRQQDVAPTVAIAACGLGKLERWEPVLNVYIK